MRQVLDIVYILTMNFQGRYTRALIDPLFSNTSTPTPDSNMIMTSD